jgi:hypothetical protein
MTRRSILTGAAALGLGTIALPSDLAFRAWASAGHDVTAPNITFLSTDFAGSLRSFFATVERAMLANPVDTQRLMTLAVLANDQSLSLEESAEFDMLRLAAVRQGRAVGAVIGFFLRYRPYPMLAEIREAGPVFQPLFGPILVVNGDAVRDVLARHDDFSVQPYGIEMRKTMTPAHNGGYTNFILGTDDPVEYEPDRALLNAVCRREDADRIVDLVASECHRRMGVTLAAARAAGKAHIDIVSGIARGVPVSVGHAYLGVPVAETQGAFALTPEMLAYYGEPIDGQQETALGPDDGIIPDEAAMYDWTKASFQHFFNNPQGDPAVQVEGLRSCRLLLCHILREVAEQKRRIAAGEAVADTMLTRLVSFQLGRTVANVEPPPGFQPARLNDLRIAEQVMGTIVGAVVGQEEAACRVVDAMLRLKEGEYSRPGTQGVRYGKFEHARSLAHAHLTGQSSAETRAGLAEYAMEALRLEPQGEVLARECVTDGAVIAGSRPIRAGTLVFAAHGSAMKDVPEGESFVLDRPSEHYLHYGWRRHTCLGRYVSEVMLVETLAAVLGLEGLARPAPRPGESELPFETRLGQLQLGRDNLYATSFTLAFEDSGSTRAFWPA